MPAPRSPEELNMGHTSSEVLRGIAAEAFARREAPSAALADVAERLASACHDMAVRFLRGGKLLAFCNGGPSTDAHHVSVEFVHPVIVAPEHADEALGALRSHPAGADAAVIGEVRDEPEGRVLGRTALGGHRMIDMLVGDPLPRIC
jgi:hypothetical protein